MTLMTSQGWQDCSCGKGIGQFHKEIIDKKSLINDDILSSKISYRIIGLSILKKSTRQ